MTLIGYWPLNESSGDTAYDHSGNENHGSLTGGTTAGSSGVLKQNAYSFDNSSGGVNIGRPLPCEYLTMTAWVNWDSLTGPLNNYPRVLTDHSGSSVDTGGLTLDDRQRITFGDWVTPSDSAPGRGPPSTSYSPNTGEWYFLAATYSKDTGDIILYVNGVQEDSYNAGTGGLRDGCKSPDSDAWIGTDPGGRTMGGKISEVRIYDRPLSKSEVQYLYQVGQRGLQTTSKKSS